MKEYISRLKKDCKLHTFILWSVMRVLMTVALVGSILSGTHSLTGQIHIAVCLVASFLWEFSQAMPVGALLRFMPVSIHTAFNAGLFVSSFFGIYVNFYYDVRFFDPLIVAFFGFWSVLYGYEIACAAIKRDKFGATKAMVFFAAFGVSFIFLNVCELGEFISDQLIGLATGEVGDAQFWSYLLSEGTARAETVIPAIDSARRPLMDIMADIVIHTVSAFAALIFINVCPYRLKGRYKYNLDFDNNGVKNTESVI